MGRTMGKTEYLSRHPSDSIENESRIKAEELWHNWFTVNGIQLTRKDTFVSANQNRKGDVKQPIGANLATTGKREVQKQINKQFSRLRPY